MVSTFVNATFGARGAANFPALLTGEIFRPLLRSRASVKNSAFSPGLRRLSRLLYLFHRCWIFERGNVSWVLT
jgi:hypothetical protein